MSRARAAQPGPTGRISRQTLMYLTLAIVAIAAIVAVALANRVPKAAQTVNPTSALQVGMTAPQFAVQTNAGPFDLSTVHTPVFLEVFATWCPHCQREVPVVNVLYHLYAGQMAFVGVSGSPYGVDESSPENQADVAAWVQRLNVDYPVAFDPTLAVSNAYLQGGYPTVVIIDAAKKIQYINNGELPLATLRQAIQSVLSSHS